MSAGDAKALRREVERKAKSLGVRFDGGIWWGRISAKSKSRPGFYAITIEMYTPGGKRFGSHDCHASITNYDLPPDASPDEVEQMRIDALKAALADLNFGLIDCDPDTCEYGCFETE